MSRSPQRGPDPGSTDKASAAEARARLRRDGIVPVEPDNRIGVMLAPGERLVTVRRDVRVERRKETRGPDQPLRGDLYVTTTRLVCIGPTTVEVPIADIREAVVTAGELRLIIGNGRGLEIGTGDPYLLRVEIAAVREAARTTAGAARPAEDAQRDGAARPRDEA